MPHPSIDDVRALCERHSNWGRWGPDDERGTLNLVTEQHVLNAASLVLSGQTISMALPFDDAGPQTGAAGRFNPIHYMTRDGADVVAGTAIRDFFGGVDRHFRSADDVIVMPLQAGTQWDSLSHIFHDGKIYNGYSADVVTSRGALKNDVAKGATAMVGRGVLLDVPRAMDLDWLEPGHAIGSDDLDAAASLGGVAVGPGDFVFVRTGAITKCRSDGAWGDYAGGDAPGLGLDSVDWIADRDIAALATDSWGMEVRPNETEDVYQPLHLVFIVHMGMWIGEIFDLDPLAEHCASDGRYEFLFCGPPLPFTMAVASPLNPMAIK